MKFIICFCFIQMKLYVSLTTFDPHNLQVNDGFVRLIYNTIMCNCDKVHHLSPGDCNNRCDSRYIYELNNRYFEFGAYYFIFTLFINQRLFSGFIEITICCCNSILIFYIIVHQIDLNKCYVMSIMECVLNQPV